jgi:site-specific recombinase XerD
MARKQRHEQQADERELEEFLGALALEGRSTHSVRAYRRDLEALLATLPGLLDRVRPSDLREYFRRQQQAGRSPSSINRAVGAARSFPFVTFLEPQAERKTRRAA